MIDLKGIKITDRHVFFWRGWLSNWYKSDIVLEDNLGKEITFHTSEQYFMWRKAMLFNDKYIAEKILDTSNPRRAKELGREVEGFDEKIWDKEKYDIMFTANFHKYNQNKQLHDWLLDPIFDNKTFVEASPYDRVWGIGMFKEDIGVDDENNWKGQNLLGKVITNVRNNSKSAKDIANKIKSEYYAHRSKSKGNKNN